MVNAPAENNERFKEADPRLSEAAKTTPEQSVKALQAVLAAKDKRMEAFATPKGGKDEEQFAVAKTSIDRRLELINSMA